MPTPSVRCPRDILTPQGALMERKWDTAQTHRSIKRTQTRAELGKEMDPIGTRRQYRSAVSVVAPYSPSVSSRWLGWDTHRRPRRTWHLHLPPAKCLYDVDVVVSAGYWVMCAGAAHVGAARSPYVFCVHARKQQFKCPLPVYPLRINHLYSHRMMDTLKLDGAVGPRYRAPFHRASGVVRQNTACPSPLLCCAV